MDWINEAKPRPMDGDKPKPTSADADASAREPTRIAPIFEKRPGLVPAGERDDPFDEDLGDLYNATPEPERRAEGGGVGGEPDDEDLDALMAEAEAEVRPGPPQPRPGASDPASTAASKSLFGSGATSLFGSGKAAAPSASGGGGGGPEDDDDDLDALMAEAQLHSKPENKPAATGGQAPAPAGAGFADDEEAMAELDGLW